MRANQICIFYESNGCIMQQIEDLDLSRLSIFINLQTAHFLCSSNSNLFFIHFYHSITNILLFICCFLLAFYFLPPRGSAASIFSFLQMHTKQSKTSCKCRFQQWKELSSIYLVFICKLYYYPSLHIRQCIHSLHQLNYGSPLRNKNYNQPNSSMLHTFMDIFDKKYRQTNNILLCIGTTLYSNQQSDFEYIYNKDSNLQGQQMLTDTRVDSQYSVNHLHRRLRKQQIRQLIEGLSERLGT